MRYFLISGGAGGQSGDEIVGLVVRGIQFHVIKPVKDDQCQPTQSLVPIDQRMVPHDGFQQDSGFGVKIRVRVSAEYGYRGSVRS